MLQQGVAAPELSRRIDELSSEKRALLALRLKRKAATNSQKQTIVRRNDSAHPPLSFAQERFWFLTRLIPNSIYTAHSGSELEGRLGLAALEQTFSEIRRRHDVLRATFTEMNGLPVQTISPFRPATLPLVDLGGLSEAEQEMLTRRLAAEGVRRKIDLSAGPLLRARLLALSEQRHVMLMSLHHVAGDGWSWGVLFRELAALYESLSAGKPSGLKELDLQYGDYAAWQLEWMQGEVLEEQLGYWKERLRGVKSIDVAPDRARGRQRSYRGGIKRIEIGDEQRRRLREIGREEGATLFMVMMGALKTLLRLYTGEEDITVGTPVAGRNRAEVEGMIGVFINMLALRTEIRGEESFKEVVRKEREAAIGAYGHQEIPFERVVAGLEVERDLSRHPVFQVMMGMQEIGGMREEMEGLRMRPLEIESEAVQYDLAVSVVERERGVEIGLGYSRELYDEVTIDRMGEHLKKVIEGVVEDPGRTIRALEMMREEERHQCLVEWNDQEMGVEGSSVLEEIEEEAVKRPDRVAVEYKGRQVSYGELNRRANRLGRYLQKKGIGAEELVGLCLERTEEMVTGVLGVMKSGGAYVPLDPTYPRERLRYMVEDAGVRVVISEERVKEAVEGMGCLVMRLERDGEEIEKEEETNIGREVGGDELAYVIYTSGSTGRPKGVEIRQRSLKNFMSTMREGPGIGADDVMVAVTTLSFDIAGLELLLPLTVGGRVVVVEREGVMEGKELMKRIKDGRGTVMQGTPSMWRMLIESGWEGEEGMKILCGGEAMGLGLAKELVERGGEVWNLYGPTETTIWSARSEVAGEEEWVSIGRPIGNTEIYVMDRDLRPAVIGQVGEVCIGGEGVGRGYLRRAEMAAERFIPNPVGRREGERLYRTGDEGRYRGDGRLEYLGRRDHQVKVRGYRIELGEIEEVMEQNEKVREAVVVAREEGTGDVRLVAYVVKEEGEECGEQELREWAKERLPVYMAPGRVVVMEKMPLMPNGKVNRGALPKPERNVEEESRKEAPRTETERKVASIWSEALKVEEVGIDEDFFELGGHSLLASRVVSRVAEETGIEIGLQKFFEKATVRRLAEELESVRVGEEKRSVIVRRGEGETPVSFAQERLWFIQQMEPESGAYNIPVAIGVAGRMSVSAMEQSIGEIWRRHEAVRTRIEMTSEGRPVQVIEGSKGERVGVVDLSGVRKEEREKLVKELAREEAARPFDLRRGPLMRTRVLIGGDEESVILGTMHHVISDGWSVGILMREMGELYEAYSGGTPSDLDELKLQYGDYSVWQREWMQGAVLENLCSYWKDELAGAPQVLRLPTDRPRPAAQSFRATRQFFSLPAGLSQEIRRLGRRERVTVFTTFLAAFNVLMRRYTGQQDILVGVPVANRSRKEIEELIGVFANLLVLRTQFSGVQDFRSLLRKVHQTTLRAYAHQELPFERLVEEVQPVRALDHHPLIQIAFAFDEETTPVKELPGLRLAPLEVDSGAVPFDLVLHLAAQGQRLSGSLTYNSELFNAGSMNRMLSRFELLLEAVAADPDTGLNELQDLLGKADRQEEGAQERQLAQLSIERLKGFRRRALSNSN